MTTYTCKECGKPVTRTPDGGIVRPCNCDAPIIAHLSAVARGEASVADSKAK
jgi:uncharacterized Zn finger protein (UPF0148 family)